MSQKWCYRCQTYYETDGNVCSKCGANLMDHHPLSPEGKRETARRQASSTAHGNSGIFDHPGRQLITVSKFIFWAIFIAFILLAVSLFVSASSAGYSVVGIFVGAFIAGIGYVVAWVSSIKLRALGALVDDVETIKETLLK